MKAWRALPALVWAAGIFWISHQPKLPDLGIQFVGFDKLMHAGAYGLLAVLLLFAAGWPAPRKAAWVIVVAALYGASDEFHQSFVPGRSTDVVDLLADTAGAALAVGVMARVRRRLSGGRASA